jgi:hypothetical protein
LRRGLHSFAASRLTAAVLRFAADERPSVSSENVKNESKDIF